MSNRRPTKQKHSLPGLDGRPQAVRRLVEIGRDGFGHCRKNGVGGGGGGFKRGKALCFCNGRKRGGPIARF